MTDRLGGLDDQEAARRLSVYGPNRMRQFKGRTSWDLLLGTLREPMFPLLLTASALYLFLGDRFEGAFLSLAALATILLVVAQERRSERALKALMTLAEPTVRVMRGGQTRPLPIHELVPGDLVLVSEGLRVPADCQLVAGEVLTVDEAALTGESVAVTKLPLARVNPLDRSDEQSRRHALFAGTLVASGQGLAEVIQTGTNTMLGRIGGALATIEAGPTPLQQASGRLVALLGAFSLAVCSLVVVAYGLIRGNWIEGALAGITVAISLIPEEFPMVLAIFMALGAWRLAQHRVLVRRPAMIEALGGATLLCVDKTGTLTENRMTLAQLWAQGESGIPSDPNLSPTLMGLLETAGLASAPHPTDAMDRAVRVLQPTDDRFGGLDRVWPLTANRMAVVQCWASAGHLTRIAAKGAPEAIFALCRLDHAERSRLAQRVNAMAADGLRVLAVAAAPSRTAPFEVPEDICFELVGLIGFLDPVRADVPEALAEAKRAGISVAMITGDYPATALAIARQAGLDVTPGVLTGEQLEGLSPDVLGGMIDKVRIFARITPAQKLAIVEAFKARGEVVAMTGDGVNDAPALQAAHIGIAMGLRGTDVAREAAGLVLLDDSFSSIVGGVRLGRRIFVNLRKALTYVVAIHVPIAGLALVPILLSMPPLLYPMHIVMMEMIIDPICALVFEAEPSEKDAMLQPPRARDEPLFGRQQIVLALGQGGVILLAVFALFEWGLQHSTVPQARASALVGLIVANLTLALTTTASNGGRLLDRHRKSFWGVAAFAVAIMSLSLTLTSVGRLFHILAPSLEGLALAVAVGAASGGWRTVVRFKSRPGGDRDR